MTSRLPCLKNRNLELLVQAAANEMSTASCAVDATNTFATSFKNQCHYLLGNREIFSLLNPFRIAERVIGILYVWIQFLIVAVFNPVGVFEKSLVEPISETANHGQT